MSYLYLLHSHHYDIDGPDTLYKFGCTENIYQRKFDSCYTTAFRYECKYVAYWTLNNYDCHEAETIVKCSLRDFSANGIGTELYTTTKAILIDRINDTLDMYDITYNFTEIDNIIPNDPRRTIVDPQVIKVIREEFIDEFCCEFERKNLVDPVKCCLCNHMLSKRCIIFHTRNGDKIVGTDCADKKIRLTDITKNDKNIKELQERGLIPDDELFDLYLDDDDNELLKTYVENPYLHIIKQLLNEVIDFNVYKHRLINIDNKYVNNGLNATNIYRTEAFAIYCMFKLNKYVQVDINTIRTNINGLKKRLNLHFDVITEPLTFGIKNGLIKTLSFHDDKVSLRNYTEAIKTIDKYITSNKKSMIYHPNIAGVFGNKIVTINSDEIDVTQIYESSFSDRLSNSDYCNNWRTWYWQNNTNSMYGCAIFTTYRI